jgi:hypothetical protein
MTHSGPEQFPNEALLPLVSQETIAVWATLLSVSDSLMVDAQERMMAEQPVLSAVVLSQAEAYPVNDTEIARMTFSALLIYTLLEMQAEATRSNTLSNERAQDGPLLPVVAQETVAAWEASSAELSESISSNAYTRMATEQLPMAMALQNVIGANASDDLEASRMMTSAVTVYKLLEMQVVAENLNEQFNPES